MKLIGVVIFVMLILGGCNESPKPSNAIAKIVNECGNNDIVITDIKGRKKSDGFMKAQVVGENTSNEYQRLEYRIVWLDQEGFVIDSILSKWKEAPAYANQPFHLKGTSPTTKAKSFRLYIKRDKEVICDKHYNGQ